MSFWCLSRVLIGNPGWKTCTDTCDSLRDNFTQLSLKSIMLDRIVSCKISRIFKKKAVLAECSQDLQPSGVILSKYKFNT